VCVEVVDYLVFPMMSQVSNIENALDPKGQTEVGKINIYVFSR
jgi:hypothetical protein